MEDTFGLLAAAACIGVVQIVLIFTILQISNKLSELIEKVEGEKKAIDAVNANVDRLRVDFERYNQKKAAPPQGFRAR